MVTPKRYAEVLKSSEGKKYGLKLGVTEIAILHGLVSLAMDHPGVQELHEATIKIAHHIRDFCLRCFRDMEARSCQGY